MESILSWVVDLASSPQVLLVLFLLVFSECSFGVFIGPGDGVFVVLCAAKPEWALLFATARWLGTITGTPLGYLIGLKGGRRLLKRFAAKKITQMDDYFQKEKNVGAAGFVAGILPASLSLFMIAAGTLKVNFTPFFLGSTASRFLRYFVPAILILIFGDAAKGFLERHLGVAAAVLIVVTIVFLVLARVRNKRRRSTAQEAE